MIRFYLDSNVFRYIKAGHPSFNGELLSLMNAIKEESVFVFSGAHLDDLKNSTASLRDEDLKLMERYVKANYFYRDPIKKKLFYRNITPMQAYQEIDYGAMDNVLKNFDLDTLLFKDLDNTDENRNIKESIYALFNSPISLLGQTIDPSKFEGDQKKWFDKVFPNYSPNMTLKEFTNSVMPYGGLLHTDAKEVTEMRKYVRSVLESDTYSYQRWGMEFKAKWKEKTGRSFLDTIDGMLLDNQKDDRYLRFQYAYALLELYNITTETVGGKTKKFNYQSLHNDAAHCYFASLCDCLITDDKGLQVKAQILYTLLDIPVKIFSTHDFLEAGAEMLDPESNFQEFSKKFILNISESHPISAYSILESRELVNCFELAKPQFGIFTLMDVIWCTSGNRRYILTLPRDAIAVELLRQELEIITRKLILAFGPDRENKGDFHRDEPVSIGLLRHWIGEAIFFQLALVFEDGEYRINLFVDVDLISNGN